VKEVIYTSSGTAYGAHPDNDFPLTEDSPLRANLDFNYPAHKLEVEYVVQEIRDEFPDMKIAVFRPSVVFGSHVDNAWSHLLELPALLGVQGFRPPLQFVHELDVADAVAFAVFKGLDGPYNLCPPDWIEWDQLVEIVGKRPMALPEPVAFAMQERLWNLGLAEAPAGMLHYVMHPWVMSPDKLAAEGFKCAHSSYDSLVETLRRTSAVVRLGKVRVERSDLRKGALAGLGLLAGAVAWRTARRHARA
jgi:UDP-glucose 4-epimerase